MHEIIEARKEDSSALKPVIRRILNDPLLSTRRGAALVMSQRKRDIQIRKAQELKDYLNQHPWFAQLKGYEREIICRMVYGLCRIGREAEADRLHRCLFTIGDFLGKEPIWPILEHLLEGGVFEFEGTVLSGNRPNTKQLPVISLLPFLATYAPEEFREGRLHAIRLLLKAYDRSQELIRSTLQEQDDAPKISSSVPPSQISPESSGTT